MQPHFLYNSLTTIKNLYRQDPEKAEQAITDFSAFLRYNMDSLSEDRPVSFHDELAYVKEYLELQQLRFGDELKVEHNRIRVLINDLKKTLQSIGMEHVLIREHRELAIRKDLIDCDYYRMLEGDMDAVNSYRGEYMMEYSWAEITNVDLNFKRQ